MGAKMKRARKYEGGSKLKREKVPRKAKRDSTPRFGGACRAFLRTHKGEGDWQTLTARYNSLSPQQRMVYVEKGHRMTVAGRAAGTKRARQPAKRTLELQNQLAAKAARLESLTHEPAGTLAVRDARGQVVSDSLALVTPSDTLAISMRHARKEAWLATQVRKHKEEQDRAALDSRVGGEQSRVDGIVGQRVETWKHFEGTVQHCPAAVDTVDVAFPGRELANKALKFIQGRPRKHAALVQKLEADWEIKHALICHDAVPPIVGATNLSGGTCWANGYCTCSAEGQQTNVVKAAWCLHGLAPHIRPGSVGRTLVSQGYFVCRVESFEFVGDTDDVPEPITEFWHISLMYLSPVRPTFTMMRLLREEDDGPVVLGTTDHEMTFLEAFAGKDRGRQWESTLYVLDESVKPLPSINAGTLYATPWGGAETLCFWPPPRKPRAPRARRPRPAALLDAEMPAAPAEHGAPDDEDMGDDDGFDHSGEGADEDAGDAAAAMDGEVGEIVAGEDGDDIDELMRFLDVLDAADPPRPEPREEPEAPPEAVAPAAIPAASGSSSSNSSSSSDTASDGAPEGDEAIAEAAAPAAEPAADVPPPPAPLAGAVTVRGPAGPRRRADVDVEVAPPHRIAFYASNGSFVAQCKIHDKCFKTRTGRASAKGRGPQGRPLGHLVAWLANAEAFADKGEHFRFKPPFEERRMLRVGLETDPDTAVLTAHERDRRDDEDDNEPRQIP